MRHTPKATKPESVLIGYCHPGHVDGMFHDSLMGVLLWDYAHHARVLKYGGYASLMTGPRIAAGRTSIVEAFLDHPNQPDWLWFLDTDMAFPADTLERLLESADKDSRPIVGGLCFGGGRDGKLFPTIYTVTEAGDNMSRLEDYPRDALCKVDATGAACILIHRSVLTEMAKHYPAPYPWFQDVVINGMQFGEDVTFCLRARKLGIPVYVDTAVKIGHVKSHVIHESTYDAFLAVRRENELVGV